MLITEFVITESCNLACTYCYMANKSKFMEPDMVDLFLDKVGNIMKLYKQNDYHISFFGGEPLLNWDIIKYAAPKFNADPRCHSVMIISNGLLLDEEKLKFIKEHNIGFSLSFDGLWQKENRPLVSGKSSFEAYIEKKPLIKQLVNSSKCMVSPMNLESLVENHIFLTQDYGFNTPDFSLVRDDIWSPDDVMLYDKEIKKLADHCIMRIKEGHQEISGIFGLYILDMIVGDQIGKRGWGCFAGKNGVGYSSEGVFYPCARFASGDEYGLYDAKKEIWYKGNIAFLLHPKVTNPREYPECQSCELYNYCNAGCTYSEIKNGNGERAVPIDGLCDVLKLTYRESARIAVELKDVPLFKTIIENMLRNSG